jgi:NAD dependent epimerase/dehydratase
MSWSGRRVLVTGAGGFIGSHLAERLVSLGAEVRALVRYNSGGRRGWLEGLGSQPARIIAGDIRDSRCVQEAVEGCEVVFHLAALIAIPFSYEAPESYLDTNVRGTLNVLEAARRHGAKVIHTSTSEVYGTPDSVPITEAHALKGQSPYSATKIGADKLVESYHLSFGLPAVVLRPFNTYGPRQSARAVLPAILSQLLSGAHQLRLGSTWPRRDLTFVEDTVRGFILAAESEAAVGQTVHLGTGRDVSIGELAALACRVVGVQAEIVSDDQRTRPEASEVRQLLSSPARARSLLGWEPRFSLEEGVALTAEWIRGNLAAFRAGEYSK